MTRGSATRGSAEPGPAKSEWEQAARRGDTARLRSLIADGMDVDARDRHGQTALMLAAHGGHAEAVRLLAEAGADLDHTAKYGLSALMLAVLNGSEPVVRILRDAGADTGLLGTGPPGFRDKSARALAEGLGREAIAELLRDDRS